MPRNDNSIDIKLQLERYLASTVSDSGIIDEIFLKHYQDLLTVAMVKKSEQQMKCKSNAWNFQWLYG